MCKQSHPSPPSPLPSPPLPRLSRHVAELAVRALTNINTANPLRIKKGLQYIHAADRAKLTLLPPGLPRALFDRLGSDLYSLEFTFSLSLLIV